MKKAEIISIAGILVLFLLIQLFPYGHQYTNPVVVEEPILNASQTSELTQRACFDCHSNESICPLYSNVAPVSWLVQRDTEQG